ncbi:hypothetical protein GOP47_0028161 [Adiantum capillus-veneris]|nr:hypothetical protein GOP47_0028161 [Adiantum capillus-veneris]
MSLTFPPPLKQVPWRSERPQRCRRRRTPACTTPPRHRDLQHHRLLGVEITKRPGLLHVSAQYHLPFFPALPRNIRPVPPSGPSKGGNR